MSRPDTVSFLSPLIVLSIAAVERSKRKWVLGAEFCDLILLSAVIE